MLTYALAFLIGVVSGLRALTAPAAVSWAVALGWLHPESRRLALLGSRLVPIFLSLAAVAELVSDQLPKTPSRKAPPSFVIRIVSGALCGAALGSSGGVLTGGLIAGALGAIAGTLGGYEFRVRLVKATGGKDLPIALLEDAIAIGGAFLIVSRLG